MVCGHASHIGGMNLGDLLQFPTVKLVCHTIYDSIRGLTYIWRTKWCKVQVIDFIHKTTFSRVKFCVETESDIKNAQLPTFP